MSKERTYIKMYAPRDRCADFASGERKLDYAWADKLTDAFSGNTWAGLVQAARDLAGDSADENPKWAEEDREGIEMLLTGSEATVGMMKTSMKYMLLEIVENIQEALAEAYDEENNCFYLEYDPGEWFRHPHPYGPGHKRFNSFASGRLFALAKMGIFKANGFKVYGTGLEEEPTA